MRGGGTRTKTTGKTVGACTKKQLIAENQSLNQDIFLLQEKLGNALNDVSLISLERAHLRDEIKDLEEAICLLDEEHKKDLRVLEQEHQKKIQYLEGVGSGLSHAISVIVSGCTVPVNEKK